MVVQHGWKPSFNSSALVDKTFNKLMIDEKYSALRDECMRNAKDEYPEEPPLSDLCPNCGFKSISYRKTTKDYRCSKCKTEFEVPQKGISPMDKQRYEDKGAVQRRIEYRFKKNLGKVAFDLVKNDEVMQKQVHLELIDDNLRYLRFEGAKTTCKRCAFLEDKVGGSLKLCPFCESNRLAEYNSICSSCSFDETTGIYTLTSQNALKWYRRDNKLSEECAENIQSESDIMKFFVCLLQKHGHEIIEATDTFLRVKTEQRYVYEALSDRKSLF